MSPYAARAKIGSLQSTSPPDMVTIQRNVTPTLAGFRASKWDHPLLTAGTRYSEKSPHDAMGIKCSCWNAKYTGVSCNKT